ncbi:MAG TPA: S41 family peptidase [Polyangiaceae bacterium]|nr:S41 family peptidase [Polyangiaceae bacterium]
MRGKRFGFLVVALGLTAALATRLDVRRWADERLEPRMPRPPAVAAPAAASAQADEPRQLSLPSGAPVRISCDDAQKVTAFLRRELAAPGISPTPAELAEGWGAMLDPHGLWSASPDSPVQAELLTSAADMLALLEGSTDACRGADRIAQVWEPWQAKLVDIYDEAYQAARQTSPSDAQLFRLVAEPIFEDDPVTRPATELARELGRRVGAFVARFPQESSLAAAARARFFPTERGALRDIATLAALRAYVPLVDPHGDFAPLDEEWALYAGDDTLDDGSPLWGNVTRTALGARITDDPASPLELDDLVLAVNGLSLVGAGLDQIEQAARSVPDHGTMAVRVLRQGQPQILSLQVEVPAEVERQGLETERIAYGRDGQVLRIIVPDVSDDLGQELAQVLETEAPSARAVLLDLRGNGGGSLDAAVEALGLLLPGARLFPLIHRGAVTEVLEAQKPGRGYQGPLAALVDGDTASAAEMLAGAIQAYGRGTLIGAHTFGKGCVQEYFDDVVGCGVLRMTTLQFVMPDGRPLQQIGLEPDLALPLAPATERESQITRQPITFDGPDVRDRKIAPGPAWPRPSGAPGPCEDQLVCMALARLAGVKPAAGGLTRGAGRTESGGRAAHPRATAR